MKKIDVYLTDHSIERVDERLLKTDMDVRKILETLNSKMKNGIFYEHPTQYPRYIISFPALGHIFILSNDNGIYEALTFKSTLSSDRIRAKKEEIEIKYHTKK